MVYQKILEWSITTGHFVFIITEILLYDEIQKAEQNSTQPVIWYSPSSRNLKITSYSVHITGAFTLKSKCREMCEQGHLSWSAGFPF